MNFEHRVLGLVDPLLKNNETAEFYLDTGTLFVASSEGTARSIYHKLSKEFGLGSIAISGPIQGEFAYDFVAEMQHNEELSPFATCNS
jgi:hypothetical protein